jgi:hypothetical protein
VSEFKDLILAAGPAGMGIFAGYLFVKEIFGFVKSRNGNGVANTIATQEMFKAIIELKSQSKIQTGLLKEISQKLNH